MTIPQSPTELSPREPHPAAYSARLWIADYLARHDAAHQFRLMEAFASSSLAGNRNAGLCGETLRRLLHGRPVSDRYILATAWTLREMEDGKNPRLPD